MSEFFFESLGLVLQPTTIFYVFLGILIGQVMGLIPGLTATMAMALVVPLTYGMPLWVAVPFLMAMLKGNQFGGSISAVLLNTPGTPGATADVLDGYPLAQQGKAKKAIKMALYASVCGETFAAICLIAATRALATFALKFGPPEYVLLMLCALTLLGTIAGKSIARGLMAAGIGLLIGCVGTDPLLGSGRLAFGSSLMMDGFQMIPILIGLLTIPEVFKQLEKDPSSSSEVAVRYSKKREDNVVSRKEFADCLPTIAKSSVIGTIIGAIPGLGGTIAAFVSYNQAVTSSKTPWTFGKGEIKGIAAPEAANSAVAGSNLIPLLAFGIPGDISAAVITGAFLLHGIVLGPNIFNEVPVQIYAIYIAILLGSFANLLVGKAIIPFATKALQISRRVLFPCVLVAAASGSFGSRALLFDMQCMFLFGVLGYLMSKLEIPAVPMIIAFLLGPTLEASIRRTEAMIAAEQSAFFLLQRPIFIGFAALFVIMIWFVVKNRKKLLEMSQVN